MLDVWQPAQAEIGEALVPAFIYRVQPSCSCRAKARCTNWRRDSGERFRRFIARPHCISQNFLDPAYV